MVTKQQKTSDVMRFTSCKIMELNNKHVGFESFEHTNKLQAAWCTAERSAAKQVRGRSIAAMLQRPC